MRTTKRGGGREGRRGERKRGKKNRENGNNERIRRALGVKEVAEDAVPRRVRVHVVQVVFLVAVVLHFGGGHCGSYCLGWSGREERDGGGEGSKAGGEVGEEGKEVRHVHTGEANTGGEDAVGQAPEGVKTGGKGSDERNPGKVIQRQ